VFSLGATLYHAVEGRPPFGTNTNPLALLHAVASGKVTPPQRAGPLTPVLMSLLHGEADGRPTMTQAATSLAAPTTPRLDLAEQQTVPVWGEGSPQAQPTVVARAAPSPGSPGTQQLPPPSREPAGPPRPAAPRSGTPKRVALVAAIVAMAVLAGIVTAIVLGNRDDTGGRRESGVPSSQSPSTSNQPSAPSTAPAPAQGPIDWQQAGQLIIDYYNGLDDLPAAWAMLSGNGRATFGDQQAFERHWAQFKQVSARNARGVTPNPDGSVNVPVDVTYSGQDGANRQEHKVLRVVIENGRLVIDSEAK
jgi:hypothetical protein